MQTTAQKVISILESRYRAKQFKPGVWRSVSPMRREANNPLNFELTITSADGEHGAWHDHKTKDGGSLYELAKHLGVELPSRERAQVENTLKAYTGLADYAKTKGVPVEVFINAKWAETVIKERPALIYPTTGGYRWRYIDGNKPKFEHKGKDGKSYEACLYGLKTVEPLMQSSGLPIVLCNGEPSVLVAQYHGLPAVCKTSGEMARYTDGMLAELTAKGDTFAIAFDCDETGINGAVKLAEQLKALGKTAVIVDLGLSDKGDLADLCKLYAGDVINHFKALLDKAKTAPAPTPPTAKTDKIGDLTKALGGLKQAVEAGKTDLAKVVENAQATIDAIMQDALKPSMLDSVQVLDSLDEILTRGFDGLRTGFSDIDRNIRGLSKGAVTVIYGATGMGKSTLTASIGAYQERTGQKGIYITTELKPEMYMLKILSVLTHIPFNDIRDGKLNDKQRDAIVFAKSVLKRNQSHFINSIRPSVAQLKTAVRKAFEAGASWCLVDSATKLANAGDFTETSRMHDTLLELARETNIPFLVTSQVSRTIEGRSNKVPQLSDALGGSTIEQNAENVLALFNPHYYIQRGLMEPNDVEYPPNVAQLIYLKTRYSDCAGKYTELIYKDGVGFFGTDEREDF